MKKKMVLKKIVYLAMSVDFLLRPSENYQTCKKIWKFNYRVNE